MNTGDTALLAASAGLPDGQRTTLDGQILEAGYRYTAASGHECRHLRILDTAGQSAATPRLVCSRGGQRFLAADVFAPGIRR